MSAALTVLRTGGQQTPVVCVHAGGELRQFGALARRLGATRTVYGLRGVSGDGQGTTLELIAARHVDELIALRERGPFVLVGECTGGVLAFEIAQQLLALGQAPPLLVLVDAFASGPPRLEPSVNPRLQLLVDRSRMLGFHLRTVARLPRGEGRRYVEERIVRLARSAASRTLGGSASRGRAMARGAFAAAAARYVPRRYPGRVILFRGSRLPWGSERTADLGWGEFVPDLKVHEIPGYFGTTILEPAGQTLAELLEPVLPAGPFGDQYGPPSEPTARLTV